jgi:hypothetical protein
VDREIEVDIRIFDVILSTITNPRVGLVGIPGAGLAIAIGLKLRLSGPSGVQPAEHAYELAGVLARVFRLGQIQEGILRDAINESYQEVALRPVNGLIHRIVFGRFLMWS